jgi:peptidoglycan-associated lipoprotein
MKKRAAFVRIVMLILCVFLVSVAGCAKKAVTKDEGLTVAEQKAAAQAPAEVKPAPAPAAVAPTADEMREQALRRDAAAAAEAREAAVAAKIQFDDIRFAFDKSTIEPEARETLKKLADWLMKNKNTTLAIQGHCDDRGTVEYNLALGQRRADAAMKYLVDLGVERVRIATISYGKERPLDPRQNEEAWAKNRRANFTVK